MRGVSQVIAAVVLIGVAIAGALLLGYYMTTSIKSSSPKGAAIAVSGVELYYLGKYKVYQGGSWVYRYHYLITLKLSNSGSDVATIETIKIIGPDESNQWTERISWYDVGMVVRPGETYSDAQHFTLDAYTIVPGNKYLVRIYYTDPYGSMKQIDVIVMCKSSP